MTRSEMGFEYPDDDGKAKRPWIRNSVERGCSACDRVIEVLKERPWVTGKILETVQNSVDDEQGIDLYVPVNRFLLRKLGITQTDKGVTFQVKSGEKAIKHFLSGRRIFKGGKFCFKEGRYSFVLNGQNALDMIKADLVGQMVALAARMKIKEADFLEYLAGEMGDKEAVLRYAENREIILEMAWYKDCLEEK